MHLISLHRSSFMKMKTIMIMHYKVDDILFHNYYNVYQYFHLDISPGCTSSCRRVYFTWMVWVENSYFFLYVVHVVLSVRWLRVPHIWRCRSMWPLAHHQLSELSRIKSNGLLIGDNWEKRQYIQQLRNKCWSISTFILYMKCWRSVIKTIVHFSSHILCVTILWNIK